MKSKGCGSLHESQTLEGRLKKNKFCRVACCHPAGHILLGHAYQKASLVFLIEIRPVSDHSSKGKRRASTTKYMESFFVSSG
jgi:hypothetical protein